MRIFIGHGTQVDPESQKVRLPPELVLKAMNHAPRFIPRLVGLKEPV